MIVYHPVFTGMWSRFPESPSFGVKRDQEGTDPDAWITALQLDTRSQSCMFSGRYVKRD